MMSKPRVLTCALLGSSLLLGALDASAETKVKHPWQLPARPVSVTRDKISHQVAISVSYRDIITAPIRKKLQSGLPTTIVMGGGVFDATTHRPVGRAAVWQSCKIVFDVWNEVYRIQIKRPDGQRGAVALGLGGVMRRCTEVKNYPIGKSFAPGRRLFVAMTVEVNPISRQMLDSIRRWVSRPPGTSSVGPGDSLFGSFVGIFVARIGKAERHISFRSNVFAVP